MYTKEDLQRAQVAISLLAKEKNIQEDVLRAELRKAIHESRNNADPTARAQWEQFKFTADDPTEEEFIAWLAGKAKASLMNNTFV